MSQLLEGENMNQPDAQTAPNYVTCHCQHCDGGIEFDASGFEEGETRTVECPHCHVETIIFVPEQEEIRPVVSLERTIDESVQPISYIEFKCNICGGSIEAYDVCPGEGIRCPDCKSTQIVPQKELESIGSAELQTDLRKAAEQGDVAAQLKLGVMYILGLDVAQDEAEAAKWFHMAAEQNDATAQCYLGRMYGHGEGVPQNDVEAVKWFRKAAEQNYAEAQHNLGIMYTTGRGVPEDDAAAVEWYRKAAEQNYAAAQNNLGGM